MLKSREIIQQTPGTVLGVVGLSIIPISIPFKTFDVSDRSRCLDIDTAENLLDSDLDPEISIA